MLWYRTIHQTNCYAATVPIYNVASLDGTLCENKLLDVIQDHAENGVAIITIHCTPTFAMLKLAKKRIIPFTSRGGGIVIRDMILRKSDDNVFLPIIDEIIKICSKNNTIISIGSSFRSGSIADALDEAYMEELKFQIHLAEYIKRKKCGVIIETPGHISAQGIYKLCEILLQYSFSIMPLGPIPTDTALDEDDTAAVIGAAIMASRDCADILSIVTADEHIGGIPRKSSIERAIRKYDILRHIIDIDKIGLINQDTEISKKRQYFQNCNFSDQKHCIRCGNYCPLRIENDINWICSINEP